MIMATMATMPVVATSRRRLAHLLALVVLTAGAAGCVASANTGIGPVLRIPEAPPRVVTQLPVSPPESAQTEAPPVTSESTDAEPARERPPTRPAPRARAAADPATDTATSPDEDQSADATQVPRELTSVPPGDEPTYRRVTLAATTALLDRLDRSALDGRNSTRLGGFSNKQRLRWRP